MAALIHETHLAGERLIELGSSTLVASRSEPGSWHEIRDGRCTCPGYQFRGACRHLTAVATPEAQVAREQSATESASFQVPTGQAALALCSLADD